MKYFRDIIIFVIINQQKILYKMPILLSFSQIDGFAQELFFMKNS